MSVANDMLDSFRRCGDEDALEALVDACRGPVQAICQRYLLDPGDVDDAVQETFVKLVCRACSITGDVSAWLRATAATTAIDLTRQTAKRRTPGPPPSQARRPW